VAHGFSGPLPVEQVGAAPGGEPEPDPDTEEDEREEDTRVPSGVTTSPRNQAACQTVVRENARHSALLPSFISRP
jgi:hypothetical protein